MEISNMRLKDLDKMELEDLKETLLTIIKQIDKEKNKRKIKLPGHSLTYAVWDGQGFDLYLGEESVCFIWDDDVKVLYEELKNRYKI